MAGCSGALQKLKSWVGCNGQTGGERKHASQVRAGLRSLRCLWSKKELILGILSLTECLAWKLWGWAEEGPNTKGKNMLMAYIISSVLKRLMYMIFAGRFWPGGQMLSCLTHSTLAPGDYWFLFLESLNIHCRCLFEWKCSLTAFNSAGVTAA